MYIVYSFGDYYLTSIPETWTCPGPSDSVILIPGTLDPNED